MLQSDVLGILTFHCTHTNNCISVMAISQPHFSFIGYLNAQYYSYKMAEVGGTD